MDRKVFCIILLSWICLCGKAQINPVGILYSTDEDLVIYDRYAKAIESKKSSLAGDLMVETARFFLGCPYVASTLENVPEGVVVNLREMDCMTLVETTTALVRSLRHPSFDYFSVMLRAIRFRNVDSLSYTDRLHYTTDWIYENEREGYVKDVTREIGGKPLAVNLSFMSTHSDSYKQLKDHPEYIPKIAAKEKEISARPHYYIPADEINACASGIENGDIVCFVTTVNGLDISHVGIIQKEGDKLGFIHASTSAKQVIVNKEPLQEYVQSIKRNSGIMIVRPLF